MRFLHQEAKSLRAYVESHGLVVRKYDNRNPTPSPPIEMSIIEDTLVRSETLWGDSLPYYLWISKTEEGEMLTLKEAAARVEASNSEHDIIIAAYPDGGLISVSAVLLPFQEGADKADWAGFNVENWGWRGLLGLKNP